MLDPFLPEKPEDVARMKEIQQDMHADFIALVKARRGTQLTGADDDLVLRRVLDRNQGDRASAWPTASATCAARMRERSARR